ncbi:zinc finger protein [Gigaspora margarita]|uniref:Zinc finger protein n=1 Tax=Gigaspora margarita TaxID=4874 RepID=A0A8H4B5I6_GIGMA|nr:zinc finger protein [Gigaspora margarita]
MILIILCQIQIRIFQFKNHTNTKKKQRTDWNEALIKSYPWLEREIVDGKALLFCRWCIAIKAENSFAKGTDSFRKYSLDRHIKIKEHELAVWKNLMIIGHRH